MSMVIPNYVPIDENHPTAAHNPYSESKLLAEKLCRGYHRDFGLQMIILRAFKPLWPRATERISDSPPFGKHEEGENLAR